MPTASMSSGRDRRHLASRTVELVTLLTVAALAASLLAAGTVSPAEAQATRIIRSTDTDLVNGFTVPAGETWEFDPNASTTIRVTGNVVVNGTLVMRPSSADITHTLIFAEFDEADFEGGGGATPTAAEFPDDIGLWVEGDGRLDIQGSPTVPWARTWQSEWAGDEVHAAPNTAGRWQSFPLVTGPEDAPTANGFGYRTELLNLTRNVIIRGSIDGYAHILIRSSAPQTIKYAMIRYMGPTIPGFQPDSDVTGRYPLHFHHSSGSFGSVVEGVVIRDSRNRAFVPHGSDGITFNNTIAFNIVGPAYWWDPPSAANPGLHESNDIVYNGAVAAKVWASEPSIHRGAAFSLGAGLNPTVINSVAVGMQGGGKDNSGFFWPPQAEGVWTFVNNRSHNNNGHGSFVWQNTNVRHVIDGFLAYNNLKSGVNHGAYNNTYLYQNVEVRGNRIAVTSSAMGQQGTEGEQTQVWKTIDTNGKRLVIVSHITNDGSKPPRWMFCDFGTVEFAEGDQAGGVDFVECDLKMTDFVRSGINPGTVVRVQDGDTAYKFTGNGAKKTIEPFYHGSIVPPPPAPDPAQPPPPIGPEYTVPAAYDAPTPVNAILTGSPVSTDGFFCDLT